MEYNVPQFIEEEAKILGPFTIQHFFILFGVLLISFTFFFIFEFWLFITLSAILTSSALALILLKVGGRPLSSIVLSAIRFFWLPRFYIWKKPGLKPEELYEERPTKPAAQTEKISQKPKTPRALTPEEIKELAKKLDA